MPLIDQSKPGAVLERRVVAEGELGRSEWRLLREANGSSQWHPFFIATSERSPLKTQELSWLPLPGSQWLFLECPIFECLMAGSRGGGKTLTLVMDFCKDVGKGYGSSWRGIMFRREYKDLDDVVKKIEQFLPKIFKNAKGEPSVRFLHSKSEYMAVWDTGEALLLRHLESEEDYESYHGHEYPWLGFEELTQWENDKAFLKMFTCCRASTPGIPTRVRATTNPSGAGHNWVKKRYQLPQSYNKVIKSPKGMKRIAICSNLRENFLLLHATPQYIAVLEEGCTNPAQAKAWIDGDWSITSGGMFDDLWNSEVHIVPNFGVGKVPRGWKLTRSYDHGQSHPFACLWWLESNGEPIITREGREVGAVRGDLVLWMEWYGTSGEENTGIRLPSRKIAQGINDRERDEGICGYVHVGPADSEIYNKLSDRNGYSPADDMEAEGITWDRADKSAGSRKRGWELLRTMLRNALPNAGGYREKPGIFVTMRCRHTINLLPPTPRDANDQDEVPSKYEDHILDAIRYRLGWDSGSGSMFRRSF